MTPRAAQQMIESHFDTLSPELQCAARWVRQNGAAMALHSMRSSVREAEVHEGGRAVRFGSRARRGGFESGWDVATSKVPTDRPCSHWFYLPAPLLAWLVWRSPGQRLHAAPLRGMVRA